MSELVRVAHMRRDLTRVDVLRPVLTQAQTRVLVAAVLVYERDGRATVRDVAAEAEKPVSTTYQHIMTLRRLGWLAWEDHRAGTLRPTLCRVPFGGAP